MMEIQFQGAAREVTGSCHLVRVNGKSILLDCGLFQGRRADVQKKNETPPIDVRTLDAVVLSHAHIDHAGRLPFLVRMGYSGPIHATKATRDLSEVMLEDAAHIQEQDAAFLTRRNKEHAEPLYAVRDAVRATELIRPARYDTPVEVIPGVTATFVDAGHILGSASVILDCNDNGTSKRLVFSGDIGRSGLAIIRDPVPPTGAHAVIMESTYGNRDHASVDGARERLGDVIRTTAARGGRVIVPAFAVGRTQELVYDLHQLANAGQIPRLPIVIDSPLATRATAVFSRNTDIFDDSEAFVHASSGMRPGLFAFPMLRFTESVEESKALNSQVGPMVVIAASGMAESGRILHHLLNGAADPRNTILVVGFMAEHTLGRRIVEKRPVLKVLGEDVPLRAHVEVINGYSAHADRTGLTAWIDAVRRESPQLGDIWLVHGEPDSQDAFAGKLGSAGYEVHCPERGARVVM
jgi:metallo-beta-lactamase family protein